MAAISKARVEKLERQQEKQGWIDALRDLPRISAHDLGGYLNTLRAWNELPPASINVERLSRTDTDWDTLTDLIRAMAPRTSPAVIRWAVRGCQLIDSFSKEQCRSIEEQIRTYGKVPEEVAAKFREIDEEYQRSVKELL